MPSLRRRGERWMVLYRDASGQQRSAGSYKSKAEAEKVKRRTVDGVSPVRRVTSYSSKSLGAYAPGWLAGHQLEQASRHNYQGSLNTWILPYLGQMQLGKVTKADVRAWVQKIKNDGAGIPAIHKAFITLSALFRTALEDELIKSNPCQGVKLPPMPKKIRHVITKEEFDRLLRQTPEEFRPLIQAAIGTGARWGECIALTSADADGNFLNITKSISYRKVKPYPKNAEHRRIKITPDLAEIMKTYPDYSKQDPANFRTYYWHPACERAGIRDFTFHDLRHTHASWLLANGCDLATLKERLGHHDLKTTQRYLHTLPTSQDAALDALDRAMNGTGQVRAA
jgi:integrase